MYLKRKLIFTRFCVRFNEGFAAFRSLCICIIQSFKFGEIKLIRKLIAVKKSLGKGFSTDPLHAIPKPIMNKILKPNENPYRSASKVALAWRIVRGFGGCDAE